MITSIKEVKKLNDIDEIIKEYESFLINFSCKPNRYNFPYPKTGDILDEDKSVKWNREEVFRLRDIYNKEVTNLNKQKNNISNTYKDVLCKVLAKEADISRKEADIIWQYAYGEGHSCGIHTCVDTFRDIAEVYNDLLEAKNKLKLRSLL